MFILEGPGFGSEQVPNVDGEPGFMAKSGQLLVGSIYTVSEHVPRHGPEAMCACPLLWNNTTIHHAPRKSETDLTGDMPDELMLGGRGA